jgi:hypothetical protein
VTAWRTITAVVLMALVAGGCASGSAGRPGQATLDRADRLAAAGAWEEAAVAYGEFVARHPHAAAAARATAARDALTTLLATQAELTRAREQLARLRDELSRRDGDLVRARQEADRLRSDLERLKEIDLKPERRR